ncbi:putative P-loop containing nucleoside triphosphate hydrolase [Medicago truncatula]|uniref:Putative P-loop containing nucleoside triphosphate hydrolase n=1 Tax=Medicago truncatula TaxID=3880 RepID=A0A396ICJ9_MEDTR|nr:putative P-loop containing nucleoside triphosphate hydrolase [Medicago truncatula]
MPCGETVGLDLMVDKVWHSLEDDNVGIIGLYGMGVAGKTTLMKRIHNELGKRGHSFDIVMWAVFSED